MSLLSQSCVVSGLYDHPTGMAELVPLEHGIRRPQLALSFGGLLVVTTVTVCSLGRSRMEGRGKMTSNMSLAFTAICTRCKPLFILLLVLSKRFDSRLPSHKSAKKNSRSVVPDTSVANGFYN